MTMMVVVKVIVDVSTMKMKISMKMNKKMMMVFDVESFVVHLADVYVRPIV